MILYDRPLRAGRADDEGRVRLLVCVADPAGTGVGRYVVDVSVSAILRVADDWGLGGNREGCDLFRLLKDLLDNWSAYDGDIELLLQDLNAAPTISRVEVLEDE